jgi:hypothetical protein
LVCGRGHVWLQVSIGRDQPNRRDEMMWMMLYEAAHIMLVRLAKWPWLKAWAMKIAKHRRMKKAIVALARRLAVIMHRIWVGGTQFRWTRRLQRRENQGSSARRKIEFHRAVG